MGGTRKGKTANLTRVLAMVGAGALILKGVRFGMKAFGPSCAYHLPEDHRISPGSPEFTGQLACLVDALLYRDSQVTVLKNGTEFYPAELAAIESARESIHLEAFEFFEGDLTREFLQHLIAKARQGVKVRLIIDAIGSWSTHRSYFKPLLEAGGKVCSYRPLSWTGWPYLDHRTHRKLLIVDGRVGFAGGAGWADHWIRGKKGNPPWRDTMFRLEGGIARSLNATFALNWLACTSEVLFPPGPMPASQSEGGTSSMVVMSTPGFGISSARILFQTLIDSARFNIRITSPYFLPDRSARHALIRAVRDRGVRVQILTNGPMGDHNSVRRASRAMSAKLIRAGVEFHEYQPSMIHAKVMTVDGLWTVAGSTNFDERSFALNSEVNIVVRDARVAAELDRHFEEDLARSRQISMATLRSGSFVPDIVEEASWIMRSEE